MENQLSTQQTVVLVSPAVTTEMLDALQARNPQVDFVHLATDGSAPPGLERAHAVLRVGLGKPELSALLRRFADVRWVHTSTAGFDWAMVPEITQNGITLTRSAAAYAIPIGEFTIALILSMAKRLPQLAAAQSSREWASVEPADLEGLRIGIIGAGGIGREVAKRAAALGMKVAGMKRTPTPDAHFDTIYGTQDLYTLLSQTDFAVIACPLTPETRGLIDHAALASMPRGSYLINVARGPVLVTDALIAALRSGQLAGAALDALDVEPLPPDDPLWGEPNLLITPHTSFKSPRNLERILAEFEQNLGLFLNGQELLNTMRHPELGY